MNSALNSNEQATVIRDNQMAKNLDFIVNKVPEKKFIVWLHNAHMIKDNYGTRSGQTMGFQFAEKNLNNSYHIAISSVNMPFRKSRWIEKYSKDEENLLHFLPSTEKNYLIDARQVINENKQYQQNEYEGMFVVDEKKIKTNWFNHYDVLVFISKGEDIKIAE